MLHGRIAKTLRRTTEDKDVSSVFQDILSNGSVRVIRDKYDLVRKQIRRYLTVLLSFAGSAALAPFPQHKAELVAYHARLLAEFATDYADAKEDDEAFRAQFAASKKSAVLARILQTCTNLVTYKKHIALRDALSDSFLRGAGLTVAPLDGLPALNFKQMYLHHFGSAKEHATFLLQVLHKLYAVSHEVYEAASSPDVDVEECVQVVESSLEQIRKQVPRCDHALAKLRDSIGLLRTNFPQYNRDYIASGNPSIMLENFVLDVSNKSQTSPQLTREFRDIIKHYRKIAHTMSNDPKMRKLFEHIDGNFSALERCERKSDEGSVAAEADEAAEGAPGAADDAKDAAEGGAAGCNESKSGASRSARRNKKRRQKQAQSRRAAREAAGSDSDDEAGAPASPLEDAKRQPDLAVASAPEALHLPNDEAASPSADAPHKDLRQSVGEQPC